MTRDRAEALYITAADRLRSAVWDPIEAHIGGCPPDLRRAGRDVESRQPRRVDRPPGPLLRGTRRGDSLPLNRARRRRRHWQARRARAASSRWETRRSTKAVPPSRAQPATTRSACEPAGPARFGNLPGSLGEVNEISQLWPRSGTSVVTVLSGSTASETAVKKALDRPACAALRHAWFLHQRRLSAGRIAIRRSRTRSSAAARFAEEGRENPLLLSGLAFAGANRRGAGRLDEDDGILTAEEVAGLNLNGVEWAVLSACDTGLGEIRAGEGVFGLRRAFQVAGARTVIMSLWPVDDQATRAWMRALYEARFRRGLSTADAVHSASVTVLSERRAKKQSTLPVYWAAFVAAGDWN